MAYDRLEPISSPWQHTATLAAEIYHAVAYYAATQGVTLPERKTEDWIPTRTAAAPEPAKRMTADEIEAVMRRKFNV